MRFLITAAACAIAALTLMPAAQATDKDLPKVTNPTETLNELTVDKLAEIAREIGGQDVQIRDSGKTKGLTFKDGDIPFNMALVFCDIIPGKCLGSALLVVVDNTKLQFTLDTLNGANRASAFMTFTKGDADKFDAIRVSIVDGGVTKKHLALEIALSVVEFEQQMKRLSSQLTASTAGPFQNAGFSTGYRPRFFAVSPDYVAHAVEPLAQSYKMRFHHR